MLRKEDVNAVMDDNGNISGIWLLILKLGCSTAVQKDQLNRCRLVHYAIHNVIHSVIHRVTPSVEYTKC